MNYLGHVHVALASGHDDPEVVLGAVLPDLAAMAGVRIRREQVAGKLGDGVRAHVAADAVFHAHPGFRQGAAALRRDLAVAGLGSGAARALGHAGWELMLDGTLVGSATEHAYWNALDRAEQVLALLDEGDRHGWRSFLDHRDARPRLRYDDPAWVADRLHAMLARRPRLSFGPEHLPSVVRTLEREAPAVTEAGPAVLADVARDVPGTPAR